MSEPLDITALENLALQFRALETAAAKARRRPSRRSAVLALAITLGVAASAGATVVVLQEGAPFEEAPRSDLPADQRPLTGTDELADARAADPAGGPDWGMRVSRSQTGKRCEAVGRVMNGKIGLLENGTFRPHAFSGPGVCASLAPGQPLTMTATTPTHETDRAVIHGYATPTVDRIEFRIGEEVRMVRPSADGSYLIVFEGGPNVIRTVHMTDGSKEVLDPTR